MTGTRCGGGLGACLRIAALLPALCLWAIEAAADDSDETGYDHFWAYADLYRGPEGAFLQSVALKGRLHIDAMHFEEGSEDFDEVTWRRFRFGFEAVLAGGWLARVDYDFDFNAVLGERFDRLTEAYIGWKPGDGRDLRILKHSAGFTLDGATSSNKLLTLQRNNLTNNLWFSDEYFTGVSLKGKAGSHLSYRAGIFSNEDEDGISTFDASYFTLASLGYDWSTQLGLDRAALRLDHVYNDRDPDRATPDFGTVISLAGQWELGRAGLWTDLATGKGQSGQSDLWGLTLMPFYSTSETIQWVLRYTYIDSDGANGVRLGRYHGEVTLGRGDRYNEMYAGVNLFFYGHKLKWQTGIEYATLDDSADDGGRHEGWGITTGLRIHW